MSLRPFTLLLLVGSVIPSITAGESRTIARCGEGWLEEIDGYPVLHLKGTPYEMGFQHGALLKERVRSNLANIRAQEEEFSLVELYGIEVKPSHAIQTIITIQKPYVPEAYFEELQGLADGAGLDLQQARISNFLPELFHCSGFAISGAATKDGTLYHGRVLDYAINWGLQDHAVIMVCEPDGAIPFVNVTYAGFIGCVTGMNAEHVSIGEMGGRGLGNWAGMPMSFLVREALQRGHTLDEALTIFRETPRTCEYYYVLADGKTNRAVGMEASWDVMQVIEAGESHPLLPHGVKDCALLSAGDRYEELVRRVQEGYGEFDAQAAIDLMDLGVAMKSNLHNVLFAPASTQFWVANATTDKQPAAEQPYHTFNLSELLAREPAEGSTELPMPAQLSQRTATEAAPATLAP
jgi:isopenicillin-N N-acyltransferase-like protein